jgi:hypothetical protein
VTVSAAFVGVPEAAPRFEIANVCNTASWPPRFDLLTQAVY